MIEPTLRGYQLRAIDDLRETYRRGARAPLLVLPTGAGKTVVFAHIAATATAKGRSVFVLVHRRELLRQASEKLTAAGVPHGMIAPGQASTADPVQVASVQTLARRLGDMREAPDLIVIDEAHHAVSGQWRAILEAFPTARLLGVTATPLRLDGAGLGVRSGGIFDAVVTGPGIADLTAQGHLVPSRIFAPAVAPDLSAAGTRAGDYEARSLAEMMGTPAVVECVIEHYLRHAADVPAILFAANVAHAEALAAALRRAGIASEALSGSSPLAEREKALSGLRSGAVKVLCSADLISEGLDVPAVGAVILLRPTRSLGLYLQQVGRGLRPAPGKEALIVLDHAGNSITHGMPNAQRRWTLDGRPPHAPTKARTSKAFCSTCASTLRRSAEACRSCGTPVHPLEPPTAGAAGTLVEITAAAADQMNALRSAPVQDLLREVRTVADLAAIQRARGFKPGWVWHQWNALAGRNSP